MENLESNTNNNDCVRDSSSAANWEKHCLSVRATCIRRYRKLFPGRKNRATVQSNNVLFF